MPLRGGNSAVASFQIADLMQQYESNDSAVSDEGTDVVLTEEEDGTVAMDGDVASDEDDYDEAEEEERIGPEIKAVQRLQQWLQSHKRTAGVLPSAAEDADGVDTRPKAPRPAVLQAITRILGPPSVRRHEQRDVLGPVSDAEVERRLQFYPAGASLCGVL